MKNIKGLIFTSLVLTTLVMFAQKEVGQGNFEDIKNKKIAEQFIWGNYKTLADYDSIPEKYLNESAVFLKKEFYKSFTYTGSFMSPYNDHPYLKVRELSRIAIKIQSKQTINEYNILSFRGFESKWDQIGIRVVKKNGDIVNIDSEKFINESDENGKYVKVSVPNLEIGDILDYYKFDNYDIVLGGFTLFNPDNIFFVDNFPIIDQHYEFVLMNKTYMIFSALNGAPEANINNVNANSSTDFRRRIVFEDKMRDKIKLDSRWVYSLRTYPCLRYQYASGVMSNENISLNFFDKEDKATSNRTEDDIIRLIKKSYLLDKPSSRSKKLNLEIEQFIKTNQIIKPFDKVECAYNILRRKKINDILPALSLYLQNNGVKHNIIYYVPRFLGSMDNVLARSDLQDGLQIHLEDKDIFITNSNNNTMFGDVPYYFDGVNAVTFPVTINKKLQEMNAVEKLITPITKSSENVIINNCDIKIDETKLLVNYKRSLSGKMKVPDQDYLPPILVKMEDDKFYKKTEGYDDFENEFSKIKNIDLLVDSLNYNKDINLLKKYFKYSFITAYKAENVSELNTIKVNSTGRFLANPNVELETSFVLNNYITKIGENYLINIGEVLGAQIDLGDEERIREYLVYRDYNSEFQNNVKINIPSGYTVEGLEKLNVIIDNESGTFYSTAKIEQDQLIINTNKVYKKLIDSKENWPNLLLVLDAAFDFQQQKILLKKG